MSEFSVGFRCADPRRCAADGMGSQRSGSTRPQNQRNNSRDEIIDGNMPAVPRVSKGDCIARD